MSRFSVTREPVAWIALVVIVLQLVAGYMANGELDQALLPAVYTALGAVVIRASVVPVGKHVAAVESAEAAPAVVVNVVADSTVDPTVAAAAVTAAVSSLPGQV